MDAILNMLEEEFELDLEDYMTDEEIDLLEEGLLEEEDPDMETEDHLHFHITETEGHVIIEITAEGDSDEETGSEVSDDYIIINIGLTEELNNSELTPQRPYCEAKCRTLFPDPELTPQRIYSHITCKRKLFPEYPTPQRPIKCRRKLFT